eukprot:1070203-Karenia_brevis.AAC.1
MAEPMVTEFGYDLAIAGLFKPGQLAAEFASSFTATVQAFKEQSDEPESIQVEGMVAEARMAAALQFQVRCRGEAGDNSTTPRAQWTLLAPDDIVQPAGGPDLS